jgi:hypothetical protein
MALFRVLDGPGYFIDVEGTLNVQGDIIAERIDYNNGTADKVLSIIFRRNSGVTIVAAQIQPGQSGSHSPTGSAANRTLGSFTTVVANSGVDL